MNPHAAKAGRLLFCVLAALAAEISSRGSQRHVAYAAPPPESPSQALGEGQASAVEDKHDQKKLKEGASPFRYVNVLAGAVTLNPFNIKTENPGTANQKFILETGETATAFMFELGFRRLCAAYVVEHREVQDATDSVDECGVGTDKHPALATLLPRDYDLRLGFVVGAPEISAATLSGSGEISGNVAVGWPLAVFSDPLGFDAVVPSIDVDLGWTTDRKAQDIHGTYQVGIALNIAERVQPPLTSTAKAQASAMGDKAEIVAARTGEAMALAGLSAAKGITAGGAEEQRQEMDRAKAEKAREDVKKAADELKEAAAATRPPPDAFEATVKLGPAIVDKPNLTGDRNEVKNNHGFPDFESVLALGSKLELYYPLTSGAYLAARGAFYAGAGTPNPWGLFLGVEIDPQQLVEGIL